MKKEHYDAVMKQQNKMIDKAREKAAKKFMKERNTAIKRYTKILQPRVLYTKEYDIFSMMWGQKKVDCTIETNFLGKGDLRFDVTKDGTIVGLEIDNFSDVLKKFNCDKRKQK